MRMPVALVAVACLVGLAATPNRAAAQNRSITCESHDQDRKECSVSNLDQSSVYLDRKLSKSDCVNGTSWGTAKNVIWVSRGCRATFTYRTRDASSGGGGVTAGTISCESQGGSRRDCYVANLDESSVTMDELLSESLCIKGESWGTSRNNIWVRNGCRARFGYTQHAGGNGSNAPAASLGVKRAKCIERAAREWAVTEDNLEITGSSELEHGQTEFIVKSKRTSGSCTVNSGGQVTNFATW